MIKLSKLTDYAIAIMTHATRFAVETPYTARSWSTKTRIPLPTVSKLLKLLCVSGLLVSQRGIAGGYRLAKPAREISIAEIIEAVEGPIALTECCTEGPHECDLQPGCQVSENWQRINTAVRAALINLSLEEMTGPITRSSLAVAQQPEAAST